MKGVDMSQQGLDPMPGGEERQVVRQARGKLWTSREVGLDLPRTQTGVSGRLRSSRERTVASPCGVVSRTCCKKVPRAGGLNI